jgi:hypothetical protein
MWFIIVLIYLVLALINIGIFCAWNPFDISEDTDYGIKCVFLGIFFPAIWVALIIWFIFSIPLRIVDFFK